MKYPHIKTLMAESCKMTRKTRTRQTRIHVALQSGYCAICHIPYNSLDDHIQSKKHLKLIGEDANYISINGFIDQKSLDPYLNLNGIESIDVNGKHIEKDYCMRPKRMSRNKTASTNEDVKSSPMSPTGSDTGHHLRSRKQINYAMSPSIDEDSLPDRPEVLKDSRETRSSSRLLAKSSEPVPETIAEEVWNSGRPKRSCNRQKRASADERLGVDKTYYKVEVMSTKLRSNNAHLKEPEIESNTETVCVEKGLIVKFKKMRNSELTRLNNEAENFLFPKKDDSSEDEDVDADGANTTVSSTGRQDSILISSDTEDYRSSKFKVEDEGSLDSTSSSKRKKRRRTHAEAFIMDNQKYYKFETPGSRLRYQGSFFSELPIKPAKINGDMSTKEEKFEPPDVEKKENGFNFNDYEFSFERIPRNEKWYDSFRRQDTDEERYTYIDMDYWNPFIMPYQIGPIPPLDPKVCLSHYSVVKKYLFDPSSASTSGSCSTPDSSENSYPPSFNIDLQDEDSKLSAVLNDLCSESNLEEFKSSESSKKGRKCGKVAAGRNPRKSPRQHASTLAILSSLIQQRKRKSRCGESSGTKTPLLPSIPEEPKDQTLPKKSFNRADYNEIARDFEEATNCLVEDFEDIEMESSDTIEFTSNLDVMDILRLYDETKGIEEHKTIRRFVNGPPGRKPGRRKKKNLTGWPNRRRGMTKKDPKNREDDDSTIDSVSVKADESEDETHSTDSIKKCLDNKLNSANPTIRSDQTKLSVSTERKCDSSDRVVKRIRKRTPKVLRVEPCSVNVANNSINKELNLQPYVRVKKLENDNIVLQRKRSHSPMRTNTRKRRMPASPKSPRMLRKPRGRWYKER